MSECPENKMRRVDRRDSSAYRWLLWVVLLLPYTVVYFHRLSIGVLRADLAAEFSLTSTAFAQIGAAYFYTYAVLQIPAGILSDSLGPRMTVTIAALITALGTAMFALAGSTGFLFLGRLVIGIGVSTVFVAILKVLALWFSEGEFATLTGLTAGVGTLGAIGAQSPLYLASQRWGWRTSFLAVAVLSAVTALLCYVIVRDRPPAQRAEENESHRMDTSLRRELAAALRNPRTWPPWVMFAGVYGSFIALAGTWGQSYLVLALEVPADRAAGLITTAVVGIAVGGILFTRISDGLRLRRMPMIVFSSLYLTQWLVFVSGSVQSTAGVRLLLLGIGLTAGVCMAALPCGKEVNHPAFSGTSTSVVNVGGFFGSALIPVIMGRVLDRFGPLVSVSTAYRYALYVCAAGAAIGLIGALLVTETRCRNIYFVLRGRAPASGS
jgi:sugar phosphate permease